MSSLALLLPLSLSISAAPKPSPSLIDRASVLVAQQKGLDAGEIAKLDKQLGALDAEAAKLGYAAVAPLSAAVFDPAKPLKLRLWLVSYLDAARDAAAFAPLEKLMLSRAEPDLLREAAARAVAQAPVSPRSRRRALCAALDADPGPELLDEALLELRVLGCEDPVALERRALDSGTRHPERAVASLAISVPPSALLSLDRVFEKSPPLSPRRLAVLEALLARVAQLRLEREHWSQRVQDMAVAEEIGRASCRERV